MYVPRKTLEHYCKIIVVDEVSMFPKDMWDLLLSHNVYILACGDPFQIPPIHKEQDNHILDNPHIFLDEVMRQAKESDIICTSMDIREGKKIKPFRGNDIQIFKKSDLISGMFFWADQIIVSTNKKRQDVNQYIRKQLNRGSTPELNDKIICCHNCWNLLSLEQENPLINGTIGNIEHMELVEKPYYTFNRTFYAPILECNISTEEDVFVSVDVDYSSLTAGQKFFTPQQEYYLNKSKRNETLPIDFNYGYAITGHKAQGSQWNKVLVIEEAFPFEKIEHARWLYTACTRAAEKLTLVLKD